MQHKLESALALPPPVVPPTTSRCRCTHLGDAQNLRGDAQDIFGGNALRGIGVCREPQPLPAAEPHGFRILQQPDPGHFGQTEVCAPQDAEMLVSVLGQLGRIQPGSVRQLIDRCGRAGGELQADAQGEAGHRHRHLQLCGPRRGGCVKGCLVRGGLGLWLAGRRRRGAGGAAGGLALLFLHLRRAHLGGVQSQQSGQSLVTRSTADHAADHQTAKGAVEPACTAVGSARRKNTTAEINPMVVRRLYRAQI